MKSHLNFPAFSPLQLLPNLGLNFPIEDKTFAGDPTKLIAVDTSVESDFIRSILALPVERCWLGC